MMRPAHTIEALRPLLDRFIALGLERLAGDLLSLAVFGSVARGNPGPDSDIDLLVVYQGDRERAHHALLQAALDLRRAAESASARERGLPTEPYPLLLGRQRITAETPWILLDVADHGIILYDPSSILEHKLGLLRARLRQLGSRKVSLPDGSWYWDLKPDLKPGETFELSPTGPGPGVCSKPRRSFSGKPGRQRSVGRGT